MVVIGGYVMVIEAVIRGRGGGIVVVVVDAVRLSFRFEEHLSLWLQLQKYEMKNTKTKNRDKIKMQNDLEGEQVNKMTPKLKRNARKETASVLLLTQGYS